MLCQVANLTEMCYCNCSFMAFLFSSPWQVRQHLDFNKNKECVSDAAHAAAGEVAAKQVPKAAAVEVRPAFEPTAALATPWPVEAIHLASCID